MIRTILGWLIAVVLIFFLVNYIQDHWNEIAGQKWNIRWPALLISGLFLLGAYIVASLAWQAIVDGFGYKISCPAAFRVAYLSNLGRYIPGKIWQVFGMVGLAKELGVPVRVSLASFALAQLYMLPIGFMVILITLRNFETLESLKPVSTLLYIVAGIVVLIFLILLIKPGGFNWGLNLILRLFRRELVEYMPSVRNRTITFLLYMHTWIFFGLGFYFFLQALIDTDLTSSHSIGIYVASYTLGYLAFISPGGLGVREAVMSAVLSPIFGAPVAASIALANRVWITFAEVVISLLALLTYRIKGKFGPPTAE